MKLWLVRHAKSDWNRGLRDFDRPLNNRGLRDGPRMQAWIARQAERPQWILSSPAARAIATARYVQAGCDLAAEYLHEIDGLYGAGPDTILASVQSVPESVVAVALVAHNPGITQAVNLMLGRAYLDNMPTFGVVQLDVAGPWSDLRFGQARLDSFMSPKGL